jgi:hypothetical protein
MMFDILLDAVQVPGPRVWKALRALQERVNAR